MSSAVEAYPGVSCGGIIRLGVGESGDIVQASGEPLPEGCVVMAWCALQPPTSALFGVT